MSVCFHNVQNLGTFSLQHTVSQKMGKSLGTFSTGETPASQDLVKHSLNMTSMTGIQKTEGALSNIRIAHSFLLTAQANLGTVVSVLNELAGDVTSLLNGTLPAGNTNAVSHKALQIMGMVKDPISRDHQEGMIIKTLRQGGSEQALYFRVVTSDFISTDPSVITPGYFKPTGNIPGNTFHPESLQFGKGFTGELFGNAVANVNVRSFDNQDGARYDVSLQMGESVVYVQEDVRPEDDKPLVLLNPAGAGDDTVTLKYSYGTQLACYVSADEAQKRAQLFKESLEAMVAGTWIPPQLDTSKVGGFSRFILNPESNYGEGKFSFTYDGQNVWFHDPYNDLIEAYPLAPHILQEAGEKAKRLGELAPVEIGTIGTLFVDEHANGTAPQMAFTFQTKTIPHEALVVTTPQGDSRVINLPDLTRPSILWGQSLVLDTEKLKTDPSYQHRIRGIIEHASVLLRDTYQNVTNMVLVFSQDSEEQHANLQSLHDLYDTTRALNVPEVASNVFEQNSSYIRVLNGIKMAASLQADEKEKTGDLVKFAGQLARS